MGRSRYAGMKSWDVGEHMQPGRQAVLVKEP